MPYITKENRAKVDAAIEALADLISETAHDDDLEGIVNYTITELCCQTMVGDTPRYKKINAVLGILEAVKQEFYRRMGGPYEDLAAQKNGDITSYEDFMYDLVKKFQELAPPQGGGCCGNRANAQGGGCCGGGGDG